MDRRAPCATGRAALRNASRQIPPSRTQSRPSRTKKMGLGFLGLLRPIRGSSMAYEQSKSKKNSPVSSAPGNERAGLEARHCKAKPKQSMPRRCLRNGLLRCARNGPEAMGASRRSPWLQHRPPSAMASTMGIERSPRPFGTNIEQFARLRKKKVGFLKPAFRRRAPLAWMITGGQWICATSCAPCADPFETGDRRL